MIIKYTCGTPFNTEAVVVSVPVTQTLPAYIKMSEDFLSFSMNLAPDDVVYGLGENMGGFNKRGRTYVSDCLDNPCHTEGRPNLYAAHNFFIVDGNVKYGIFVDFPGRLTFDIGFTDKDVITVSPSYGDYVLYIVEGDSVNDIIHEFRQAIGESYVAPKWAFGYQQSRWGYKNADDVREVVAGHKDNNLPLDAVYLDIDYMVKYEDFTVDEKAFPDFKGFVTEMKNNNIHLVPIIDAGVKIEEGYDVYEEGVKNNYFCKDENGDDFVLAVWPGRVHFPDFLNPDARKWFGNKYEGLVNMGIDGFWNDMNEPSIFYSDKHLNEVFDKIDNYKNRNLDLYEFWEFTGMVSELSHNPVDYASFYHNVDNQMVCHEKVHNLFGYNMTRAAAEGFKEFAPDKKMLLFSRSSYIGMHRYAGIWTGDNCSWWSHIELLMHQLPALNMCGFMYTGADTGGFGDNTTEDLMMRFIELSIFTPLFRNHSALGTRCQELYRFKDIDSFRNLLGIRYGLIPYIYSEYLKSVKNNTLMFSPLGIAFPSDAAARHIEDQLMVGENIMIAPVYQPNTFGRHVYLPEDMTIIRFRSLDDYDSEYISQGHHYIDIAINEVVVFIRKSHGLILGGFAHNITEVSENNFKVLGEGDKLLPYELYINENESEMLNF